MLNSQYNLKEEKILEYQSIFQKLSCALLRDSAPHLCHVLSLRFQSIGGVPRMSGPVFPVKTENDMLPCLQALDAVPPSYILFIQNISEESEALAGDIFVTAAMAQRVGGIIIDGAIRDVDEIRNFKFPVYASAVNFISSKTAVKPARSLPEAIEVHTVSPENRANGKINLEMEDWIFCDSDGALIIKKESVSAVLAAARVLDEREDSLKNQLKNGNRFSDLCGLKDYVAGKGELRFTI